MSALNLNFTICFLTLSVDSRFDVWVESVVAHFQICSRFSDPRCSFSWSRWVILGVIFAFSKKTLAFLLSCRLAFYRLSFLNQCLTCLICTQIAFQFLQPTFQLCPSICWLVIRFGIDLKPHNLTLYFLSVQQNCNSCYLQNFSQ